MNTTTLHKKEGFTIIEVVLVLAIAALIMLLVFLAWPALQRGQRDQGRKADIGLVGSAVGTYKTNNRGKLPDNQSELTTDALAGVDLSQYDNDATSIIFSDSTPPSTGLPAATPEGMSQMYFHKGASCDGSDVAGSSGRAAAITIRVEGNSSNPASAQLYCQDV